MEKKRKKLHCTNGLALYAFCLLPWRARAGNRRELRCNLRVDSRMWQSERRAVHCPARLSVRTFEVYPLLFIFHFAYATPQLWRPPSEWPLFRKLMQPPIARQAHLKRNILLQAVLHRGNFPLIVLSLFFDSPEVSESIITSHSFVSF